MSNPWLTLVFKQSKKRWTSLSKAYDNDKQCMIWNKALEIKQSKISPFPSY